MELLSLLQLYTRHGMDNEQSFIVMMGLLYFNAACYMVDLYGLLKKKTQGETVAVMMFPGILAIIGSAMVGILTYIPAADAQLSVFARRLESERLMRELIVVAVFYALAWTLAWSPNGQHRDKKAFVRWILSCIPDFISVALILTAACCRLISGGSIFAITREWSFEMGFKYDIFLWCFLHIFAALLCKIILLFVGSFTRLYTRRIPHPWKEGRKPLRYVISHFLIYQNALLRSSVITWTALLGLIIVPMIMYGELEKWENTFAMIVFLLFMFGSALFVTMIVIMKPVNAILRFGQWGNRKEIMLLFCRETNVEEPVIAGGDFTVTKHFLIDEQSPAAVYYWNELEKCHGWTFEKNKWVKRLAFRDGQVCELSKNDPSCEAVSEFAKKYLADHAVENIQRIGAHTAKSKAQKRYDNMIQKMVMIVVIVFVAVSYNGDELFKSSSSSNKSSSNKVSVQRPSSKPSSGTASSKPSSAQAGQTEASSKETPPEDDIFPLLTVSNDNFSIYASSVKKGRTQDTVKKNGKVYIVNVDVNSVILEVRDANDNLLQEIKHTSTLLEPKYTILSGDSKKSKIAKLEDVNFDGFDDLLLLYDNKKSSKWSAYLWDDEAKKFCENEEFKDIGFYRIDTENERIWGQTYYGSDYSIETYAYTQDKGFQMDRKLLVTRVYGGDPTVKNLVYEEYAVNDGEEVMTANPVNYSEVDDYWKKGWFEYGVK